ncbi:nudix hydrolase 19, chloroplastic isoform X2 [Cryptomeria japonica]|uniref:nudix hydrolase 19, chloroplastic isoform X2 n=1 Tax=Cryptomeria japonica TaxID=3369 RepID=UPI0027D9E5C3|nr:nudix hydrolase 19, chloroplastic isoform X2 [Cryptomeria japonica]
MATSSREHAFAGNPLIGTASTPTASSDIDSAVASIHMLWLNTAEDQLGHKILPFKQGKPLVVSTISSVDASQVLTWHLAWQSIYKCKESFQSSDVQLGEDLLVYLGQKDGVVYWALDFTETGQQSPLNGQGAYVELRTLMTATDLSDENSMAELSIAGHARALLEWHSLSQFCGKCGTTTLAIEAGRRRQCQNSNCKKRFYPRVDPVVIMLVIDKANDRALLSRQARFVPRMWSCLAGFIEPGESLEEAVRRETWEEVGIEVGEIVYHSSQPWPEAKWHSREDVQKALTFAEYDKSQRKSAFRVHQICDGAEKGQSLFEDLNVETRELAPMFVPGPFAIAHHLISSWANKGVDLLES